VLRGRQVKILLNSVFFTVHRSSIIVHSYFKSQAYPFIYFKITLIESVQFNVV